MFFYLSSRFLLCQTENALNWVVTPASAAKSLALNRNSVCLLQQRCFFFLFLKKAESILCDSCPLCFQTSRVSDPFLLVPLLTQKPTDRNSLSYYAPSDTQSASKLFWIQLNKFTSFYSFLLCVPFYVFMCFVLLMIRHITMFILILI